MDKNSEFSPYEQDFLQFDPIVIVRDVLKKWFVVVAAALIIGVAAYIITDFTYTPEYQTTSTLVVTTRDNSSSVYANLSSTTELAAVFTEVLNSSLMRKNILEYLDISGFDGTITASRIGETNLLLLQVRSEDPRTSFLVMKAIIENHEIVTYEVIGDMIIEVLQHPTVPAYPINSSNASDAMKKAGLIAAVASVALLTMLSLGRNTVRSRNEAEKKLDCWCLGEISHEKKYKTISDYVKRRKKSILLTRPETSFQYVTTMDKLRRRVEQQMRGKRLLMVTSLLENEGKSTIAVNLALAMAKKYSKVLLIDCDLHKPACRKILEGAKPKAYLQDVLQGSVPVGDALTKDRLSGLHVLYSKKVPFQTAGDMINSPAMAKLFELARKQYDFVVIDLPPMSVATDSESVTEHADASLLVVRQNEASVDMINRSVAVLNKGKAKLLGCVLNNVFTTFISTGEGYGSGYSGYSGYSKYGKYGKYGAYASQNSGRKGE